MLNYRLSGCSLVLFRSGSSIVTRVPLSGHLTANEDSGYAFAVEYLAIGDEVQGAAIVDANDEELDVLIWPSAPGIYPTVYGRFKSARVLRTAFAPMDSLRGSSLQAQGAGDHASAFAMMSGDRSPGRKNYAQILLLPKGFTPLELVYEHMPVEPFINEISYAGGVGFVEIVGLDGTGLGGLHLSLVRAGAASEYARVPLTGGIAGEAGANGFGTRAFTVPGLSSADAGIGLIVTADGEMLDGVMYNGGDPTVPGGGSPRPSPALPKARLIYMQPRAGETLQLQGAGHLAKSFAWMSAPSSRGKVNYPQIFTHPRAPTPPTPRVSSDDGVSR